MQKLRKLLFVVIFSVIFLIALFLLYLKSPLNSEFTPTGIDGSKRYYELLNKHPRTPDEFAEFEEETRNFDKKIAEYLEKRKN